MRLADFLSVRRAALDALASSCGPAIESAATLISSCLKDGGVIFFVGNGGSAADAQHFSAEFVGRFQRERRPLPAIALTSDSCALTAIANDFGYDEVFARQVQALVCEQDVVVGLSTSGASVNVLRALKVAMDQGAKTVGLTGLLGGEMASVCDVLIKVPSSETPVIQELHTVIGHFLCWRGEEHV